MNDENRMPPAGYWQFENKAWESEEPVIILQHIDRHIYIETCFAEEGPDIPGNAWTKIHVQTLDTEYINMPFEDGYRIQEWESRVLWIGELTSLTIGMPKHMPEIVSVKSAASADGDFISHKIHLHAGFTTWPDSELPQTFVPTVAEQVFSIAHDTTCTGVHVMYANTDTRENVKVTFDMDNPLSRGVYEMLKADSPRYFRRYRMPLFDSTHFRLVKDWGVL